MFRFPVFVTLCGSAFESGIISHRVALVCRQRAPRFPELLSVRECPSQCHFCGLFSPCVQSCFDFLPSALQASLVLVGSVLSALALSPLRVMCLLFPRLLARFFFLIGIQPFHDDVPRCSFLCEEPARGRRRFLDLRIIVFPQVLENVLPHCFDFSSYSSPFCLRSAGAPVTAV